ncbi:hypothetical protein JAAARDRAFT_305026 [Jaapia argillacea MUCL 33604]|uniref:Uncharacterized protein n=1 Tax=Jaapia argillacea MUCL 33604 TaxID=933084 RepID=A0A067Q083_9AGAM|nr:hypothetical protein JAAARDRAFT_305026 [Jaapia argillacea MUCL 33604]
MLGSPTTTYRRDPTSPSHPTTIHPLPLSQHPFGQPPWASYAVSPLPYPYKPFNTSKAPPLHFEPSETSTFSTPSLPLFDFFAFRHSISRVSPALQKRSMPSYFHTRTAQNDARIIRFGRELKEIEKFSEVWLVLERVVDISGSTVRISINLALF